MITEYQYKKLASDIIVFIIGTVLAKAIQFLLMPLYTSCMTTEAYGVAELTNNLAELFFPIATLCIHEAAFRFAVDPGFENSRLMNAISKVMVSSLMMGFIAAVMIRVIFKYEYAYYLYFILYAYSIRMCAAYYIRGIGLSKVFALSGIVNAFSLGMFNVVFLVILKRGVIGYLVSIGLSYCVSAIYLLIRGRIFCSVKITIGLKSDLKVLFHYCTPVVLYNILYWFTTIFGRYILLWFTDSATVGKYVAAIKISAVINMIQQAVYAAFQLNSSRIYTESNKELFYSEVINVFISIYCVFGALVVCLTPLLAKITLKKDFYSAGCYLPAIMLAAIINCISSVIGTMYSTYKQTQKMVGVSIVGLLVNMGIGIILTPVIGIWGVCVASVCCYACQLVYKYFDVGKFCKINYQWKYTVPDIILLLFIVFIMSANIPYNVWIALLLWVLLLFINKNFVIKAVRMVMQRNPKI